MELTPPAGARVPGRPPPPDRLRDRVRRRFRALGAYTGLWHWLLLRGTVVVAAFAVLYVANGLAIGWRTTYDVTIGVTSPGDEQVAVPLLAWFLSVAGWLAAPALAGAVAGTIIGRAVSGRRQQSILDVLTTGLPG